MSKPDDHSLDPHTLEQIRGHARKALRDAGAMGRFPTPVADVMAQAKVVVAPADALTSGLLGTLRKTGAKLKSAISKVLGVLDAVARLVYLDHGLYAAKKTFVKLHETAHAVLPWQCDLYGVVEDCELTLDPEMAEQFEREANIFASEVLFQLDTFIEEARSTPVGILVPVQLAKRYGSSIYAAVRQYVTKHHRACCVLVLNPPELKEGAGFVATLRRAVASPAFLEQFGPLNPPSQFTPQDQIGAMVPLGNRRMSRPRSLTLTDRNGTVHECVAEAFTQGHQVFVLIHAVATLSRVSVIVP